MLAELTTNLAVDGPIVLGGERGPLPRVRRMLKRLIGSGVGARVAVPLDRQRRANLAMRVIAEAMLRDREDADR